MIIVAGAQGVASLNQVGHRGAQFWCGGTAYARLEGRQQGVRFLRRGQSAPPPSARGSGERCKLPHWVRTLLGELTARAPTGFLATCHQIPSPGTWPTLFILASCNCVLSCLCLYDCNTSI